MRQRLPDAVQLPRKDVLMSVSVLLQAFRVYDAWFAWPWLLDEYFLRSVVNICYLLLFSTCHFLGHLLCIWTELDIVSWAAIFNESMRVLDDDWRVWNLQLVLKVWQISHFNRDEENSRSMGWQRGPVVDY